MRFFDLLVILDLLTAVLAEKCVFLHRSVAERTERSLVRNDRLHRLAVFRHHQHTVLVIDIRIREIVLAQHRAQDRDSLIVGFPDRLGNGIDGRIAVLLDHSLAEVVQVHIVKPVTDRTGTDHDQDKRHHDI